MSKIIEKSCQFTTHIAMIDGVEAKNACMSFQYNVKLAATFLVFVNTNKSKIQINIGREKYRFDISEIIDYIDRKSIICGIINVKNSRAGLMIYSPELRTENLHEDINAYGSKLFMEQGVNYFFVHDAKIR